MNLDTKQILARLGRGDSIAQVCAAAGLTRQQFEALWQEQCRKRLAPATGQYSVPGLRGSARITRDRRGVPHVEAENDHDLFFAFGYAVAQDRLFQLDYLRRKAQGTLAEILGPNFIERDAMTRRMQYVGDLDAEWASYGSDAKAIASAFVRGVNEWVALAQTRPPEEFVLAGWRPEFWTPLDLLNRTDAFVASGDAVDEVARRHFSPVVADAIRRVGTRPFLAGSRQAAGIVLENPSPRYLVHLHAPGWNVIGATAPWRPGVAVGHNDRVSVLRTCHDCCPRVIDSYLKVS